MSFEEHYQEDCIFCKIARGEVPCLKVYEDAEILAFLDTSPASKGHTLVITKEHFDSMLTVPGDLLDKTFRVAQKVAQALETKLGAKGINILTNIHELAGQSVHHFHVHVIPRYNPNDGLKLECTPLKLEKFNLPVIANDIKKGI
ncbi:MAG: HIT family protein [Bacilli bacterium]